MITWNGKLSRIDAIRILDMATDRDDPYWEDAVQEFYHPGTDTIPSIMHVFAALGVTEEEYRAATGADNLKWPKP